MSAGGGAYGNSNPIVAAADHVDWQDTLDSTGSVLGTPVKAVIPEPERCLELVLGLYLYHLKHWPRHSAARRFASAVIWQGEFSHVARNGVCIAAE
jgi:hypothetical protein